MMEKNADPTRRFQAAAETGKLSQIFPCAAEFHLGRSRLVFERNYFPPLSVCKPM